MVMLDGYCGLYCGACPVMIGTKAGTETDPCQGCKSDRQASHCGDCEIKECARKKHIAFCYECTELKFCEPFKKFVADPKWPYHQGVYKNFDFIRQEGPGKWLKEQESRWQCTHCGSSHSWWDETCPQCGQTVQNYKADL